MSTSALEPSSPPYLQIAEELRRQIEAGELAPGQRVPSTRAIVERWGVAMATATKVLTELRREGLVRAVPGVGTVVDVQSRPKPATPAPRRQGISDGGPTSERIVAAGIAVADAEGLGAVTMRRVAGEVGIATMSIYRHVEDKDDLLLRMLDAVFGEWRFPPEPPPGWRAQVEMAARTFWEACRRHPWLASAVSITRPLPTEGGLPFSEFLLTALDGLGLDHQTTFTAYITLVNYVRGMALNLEQEAEAEAVTGVDSEEWLDAQAPRMQAMVDLGTFPVFTRYVSQEYDFSLDQLFEFGLGRLLDGLAALVERRSVSPTTGR
ncbi:MAG: TetR/AcrR family transcriptional regulator C-terminal domain-containing protein [Candidatus Dormibacteraeota bacterium]|nr:TetR/AcrR family transcriptional regulator C-terminal domain-containing protein [Candidatus Dormibacteraeota bacterium]